MYYVPCPKETLRLSRVRSETTVESSHSGRPLWSLDNAAHAEVAKAKGLRLQIGAR